jgi:hypothetical protein
MGDEFYPIEITDLYPGTAFYWKKSIGDRSHLYFVLTDPDEVNGKVVVVAVNITGKTERGLGSDHTVILNVDDHPFITKPSVVVYRRAEFFDASKLVRYINEERSLSADELDDEVFQKIQKGVIESELTPPEILEYCQQKFDF